MTRVHGRTRRPRLEAGAGPQRRGTAAVLLAAFLAAVFVLGLFLIPWLEARGVTSVTPFRLAYAPLCHQIDSRSLQHDGHAVAVCARCTGLYLGGLAGLLLAAGFVVGRRRDPRPWWFAVAVTPTLIDALLPRVGSVSLPNGPRFLLALPAGLMIGIFLSIGIYDLLTSRKSIRSRGSSGPGAVAEEWDG
jgi:uncharacterized membrane protein